MPRGTGQSAQGNQDGGNEDTQAAPTQTGLALGAGRGCHGVCPENRLLPPSTVPFVQETWRLITDSQGRETGAQGSARCHRLPLPKPPPRPVSPELQRGVARGSADQKEWEERR